LAILFKSYWKGARSTSRDSAAVDKRKGILYGIWCGFETNDELLCKTVVLFPPCTVNDYNLLVLTNARIILICTSHYLTPTCFGWSPSSGSSEQNCLKLTTIY